MTPQDLINAAFQDAGIVGQGQTPSAESTNAAFSRLNMMVSQWNAKRWLIYQLVTTDVLSTGAQSYTIGPGGDFDTPRPDKLESAYMRLVTSGANPTDYPLDIISAREDYNRIALKSLVSFPDSVYYEPEYPLGRLYFVAIPQASSFRLFVTNKLVVPRFTSLTQTIALPEVYEAALHYNLVVRLGASYRKPVNEVAVALAKDALNTIRMSNAGVPDLQMPIYFQGGGGYNILSDRSSQ
jgi:hypothetical protein